MEFFIDFVLELGLFVIAADVGGEGFLIEEFTVDLDLEIFEVGLRGFELILGVQRFALKDGIA